MALLLGWGPVAAVALAGVTWVSSSGVIAKLLRDLGRLSNRETPAILAVLVIEDLAMAFYLPVLSAIVIGVSLLQGAITVAIAVGVVAVILYVALRHGHFVSRLFPADQYEPLLLGVLGLTMLVAGLAAEVSVSAAVGAFLVGIALSGRVAENASTVLTPLRDLFAAIFFVFFGLTTDSSALVSVLLPGARARASSRSSRSSSPGRTRPGGRASARSASGAPVSRSRRAASSRSSSPGSPSAPAWRRSSRRSPRRTCSSRSSRARSSPGCPMPHGSARRCLRTRSAAGRPDARRRRVAHRRQAAGVSRARARRRPRHPLIAAAASSSASARVGGREQLANARHHDRVA